jgi:hypothetical protein
MSGLASRPIYKPRELRRRVKLRARMRASSGWSDACILNVSSRGVMINAPSVIALQGNLIELWHGEQVIVGTVVWRKGTRAGLQADQRIPVDDILALSQAPALQVTAGAWPHTERRRRPRDGELSRLRGRAIEFVGVVAIAGFLAMSVFTLFEQAFAHPMRYVEAAIGG